MTTSQKRRQASAERHAAKRKEKQRAARQLAPPRPGALLARAGGWPLEECLIARDWNREGELVQIVVARRADDGQLAAATFLVDLGCLGVKNASARLFESRSEYDQLKEGISEHQPMVKTDLNLAARIVREATAYARGLGFSPHRDYYVAVPFLEGADPDASPVQVPLGMDGKPFYMSGPFDDPARILAKLDKAVGPGNYHYVVGGPPP